MQKHRLVAGWSSIQLPLPFTNDLPHLGLSSAEVLNLPTKRTQFFFREIEDAMTGHASAVPSSENLRKFTQRETQMERTLCEVDALDGCRREQPIPATRPLRRGKDTQSLVMTERVGADAG
jgi:hypothetical protein